MVSFLDHNKLVFPNYEYHEFKFDIMIASVSTILALIGISFSILNFKNINLISIPKQVNLKQILFRLFI
ncbi:MAG: hypothetical protein CM15mP91_2890 [Chloroflexota bacterium]|nr:MAG: hypothetical protein CM15mP91_2890 [Chloroflexota bacterium]